MNFLTESRIAIALSAFALGIAFWQALEARKANEISHESVLVEAEPTNLAAELVSRAECSTPSLRTDGQYGVVVFVNLRWKVTLFNASSLPVTVKTFEVVGHTPLGPAMVMVYGPDGSADWPRPVVLPAKEWAAYYVDAPSTPSDEFQEWFVRGGGCEGRINWKDIHVRNAAGFFDGGWKKPNQSSVVVTVKTGLGAAFSGGGVWPDRGPRPSQDEFPTARDASESGDAQPVVRPVPTPK